MKKFLLGGALLLISSLSASAMTQTIAFGSTGGAITFTGNGLGTAFTFEFTNAGGGLLPFDQTSGPAVPSFPFSFADLVGTFTVVKPALGFASCGTGCETAAVTGSGTFKIFEFGGLGGPSADAPITFSNIRTQINNSASTTGTVQLTADLNVGQFTYGGTDPALIGLTAYSGGRYFVTFNPQTSISLTGLLSAIGSPTNSYSFSSTLTMVPEPSFYSMMLAPAVAGILFFARKRKQADNV